EIKDRDRLLVQTPEAMNKRFKIDVRVKSEVTKINRQDKSVEVKNLNTGETYYENYDFLILSPGAEPVVPPIPGSESELLLTLRNMQDMDNIIKIINDKKPDNAVVIGGGYIGLEMAEALKRRNITVTLVELMNQVMGTVDHEMATPLHHEIIYQGIDLRLETSVSKFNQTNNQLDVTLSTGETINAGFAIMAIGVKPDVQLAKDAELETGERGGIIVDNQMKTSDPSIFAVGDAVEITDFVGGFSTVIPLAGPANRQGRIAADNIFGRNTTYKNTQ
ncbi:MAG: FAD-dependent oxidoreductase, partial [Victivallaceae bacterium]|nr:FAD-dependent oxidoreductase [Victivallaceae bacterium]